MRETIRCREDAIHFARALGADAYRIMVWAGPPGLSKTRTIEETLGEANIVYLSGDVSPYQLCKAVHANREAGKIVIDDVETPIRNPLGTRLLKAFCQAEEVKVVGWHKATKDLAKDGIPRQYETSARFCLVCNDEDAIKKHLGPLIDRGVLVRFRYPAEEDHRMVGQWLHLNGIDREAYDFIGSHLAFAKGPSARPYKTASDTKKSNPGIDWREAVPETFGLDEDEVEVARLSSDPKFPPNSSRWVEFHRRGFGSLAKSCRIAGEMRLSDIRSEGDAIGGSLVPAPSKTSTISPSENMEAFGFPRPDPESPEQPGPGQVSVTSGSNDANTIPIHDRSDEPSWPGTYAVMEEGWIPLSHEIRPRRLLGAGESVCRSPTMQPGAYVEDIDYAGPIEGATVLDLREKQKVREVGRLDLAGSSSRPVENSSNLPEVARFQGARLYTEDDLRVVEAYFEAEGGKNDHHNRESG